MVLTKADLLEWNSHPVTIAVFSKIAEELQVARESSSMRETVDETALRTAFTEGFISGGDTLREAYEITLDEVE